MTITEDRSAAALEHVRYEIEAVLQTPPHDASNETIVETIYFRKMAHARALFYFFTTPIAHRHGDDILAEDYGFPAKPIYTDQNKQRFLDRYNKDLLHISYTRLDRLGAEKQWPIPEMLPPVIERCRLFIPHVISLTWPSIRIDERTKWQFLIPDYLSRIPLQQHTSNVAAPQISKLTF